MCHAPLAPDNPACIVWSVWAYWQDSAAEFVSSFDFTISPSSQSLHIIPPLPQNRTGLNPASGHLDTYLDHLVLCSRNPTLQVAPTQMEQSCMSRGGVPVQPYAVLGGFEGSDVGEDGYTSELDVGEWVVVVLMPDCLGVKSDVRTRNST